MDAAWGRARCYCDQCLHEMIVATQLKFHDTSLVPKIDFKNFSTDDAQFKFVEGLSGPRWIYFYDLIVTE